MEREQLLEGLNNILQVGTILMQGATIGAINKNTEAVNEPKFVKDLKKKDII